MKRFICIFTIPLLAFLLAVTSFILCGCGDESVDGKGTVSEENDGGAAEGGAKEDMQEEEGVEEQDETGAQTPPVGFGYGTVQGGSGGLMLLEDVTFAKNGDYDRVIVELTTGQEQPPREGACLYSALEGVLPYADIEGNPITIGGDYYFEITLDARTADLTLPDAPSVYEGPETFDVDMELIKDAAFVPAYADHTIILVIGLGERAPFRIEELSNPSRIVIDFAPS